MKLNKISEDKKNLGVAMNINTYSKDTNTYSAEDLNVEYYFDTFIEFENYCKKFNKRSIQTGSILKLQIESAYYFEKKDVIIVFMSRVNKSSYQRFLNVLKEEKENSDLDLFNRLDYLLKSKYADELIRDYWAVEEEKKAKKFEAEGYVNYTFPLPKNKRIGSLTFLYSGGVKDYIDNGGAFGYIGHGFRQHYMDEYIEGLIKKFNTPKGEKIRKIAGVNNINMFIEIIGCWMTSSSGRHNMDSLEGDSRNEFKQNIKRILLSEILRNFNPTVVPLLEKEIRKLWLIKE